MVYLALRQLLHFLGSLFLLSLFTFGLTLFFPHTEGKSFVANMADLNQSLITNDAAVSSTNIVSQYFTYINHLFHGELGSSMVRDSTVIDEFLVYFPATFELVASAIIFALLVAIPLGIFAARNKNLWLDKLIISTTLVAYSMPLFWWAMLLILFFSIGLGVTPVAGRLGFEFDIESNTGLMLVDTLLSSKPYALQAFQNALHHLILPTVVLGTIPLAVLTRTIRSTLIDVLNQDYIQSLLAKGMSSSQILWKHGLRNAAPSIVTALALQISVLITGSLITEIIFSWPGLGKWLLDAVYRRDFAVIHAGILTTSTFVIFTHLFLDFVARVLDPKQRYR